MAEMRQTKTMHLPPRLAAMQELAENLWWSWHPAARMVFKLLDRRAWKESGHNPVLMLNELPGEVLDRAADDPQFLRRFDAVISQFRREMNSRGGWFAENIENHEDALIAYFSAEYGLHHSLPFYAGGLGFLAGDHVKECSDLGVPLVGVGFMYPEGYLHQHISADGWQENLNETLDRDAASIARVIDESGRQLVVKIPLVDPPVHVAVWKVMVGRITVYLMDTDIDSNDPVSRQISSRLYIGDTEQRLRQEIVLGIGGTEVLEALNIKHSVLHLNEGHPAFALLERVRERMRLGVSFEEAVRQVRATSVFTTHTPVPAGHDVFPFALMDKYFSEYWTSLGLDRDSFMRLGAHPADPAAGFNMTAFALRMCDYRNGVSRRHGEVSRRMWRSLWPDLPEESVPIGHVTNGIHVPTWIEPKIELLFNEYFDPGWLSNHDDPYVWQLVDDVPDDRLWQVHCRMKAKLIDYIREQARKRWADDRADPGNLVAGGALLEPAALTIGFARRFATYKRADLILYDTERLKRLLNNRWRPVQIIFAGKAHPADDPGKRTLQRIHGAARNPELGGRIAFVEEYGEQLAQYMVHGVDVWLSNPLPPLEASGTSGMKAALNGVPNLSILDGWWIEGYDGTNGWAFGGDGAEGDRDRADAEAIYHVLETEVVPLYYRLSDDGVPHEWVRVMKASIKTNAARFSARRMVKEYAEKFYGPALRSV